MPHIHTRDFRIRHYECDAYGHLYNANYLRLMQETAFDASAAVGYDLQRYRQMGRLWLIRQTEIEYLQPLHYNEIVQVRTWVEDFRRSTSRRAYEFLNTSGGTLTARATSTWVFLNSVSGQPARIPDELARAFIPEGLPQSRQPWSHLPQATNPPPGAYKTWRKVVWRDIDSAHHVNNAVYLEYCDECGFQAIAAHGWPVRRMLSNGFAILVRKNQILYRQPARLDDELEISTWVSDVRRSTAVRHYHIRRCRDNALLAEVHALGVWVELQSGRPARIPPQMLTDFQPNMV